MNLLEIDGRALDVSRVPWWTVDGEIGERHSCSLVEATSNWTSSSFTSHFCFLSVGTLASRSHHSLDTLVLPVSKKSFFHCSHSAPLQTKIPKRGASKAGCFLAKNRLKGSRRKKKDGRGWTGNLQTRNTYPPFPSCGRSSQGGGGGGGGVLCVCKTMYSVMSVLL